MTRHARYLLISITAGFVLLILVKSFYLTQKYGGTDLRCRVVGARLITTPYSPYYYKWQPADGEFYLNPNDKASAPVNGNVVTPAVLTLMYPLCQLPYSYVRLIWTVLQILAAAGIIFLIYRTKNFSTGFLLALPILLGFICSDLWLYNIERGQMYVFYAFLFALMYRLYISHWKYNHFISGFIGGLFILFRPFAVITGLGFLLYGKKQWLAGAFAGFIFGAMVFVLPQRNAWRDYFSAMQEYVNRNLGHETIIAGAAEPIKPTVIEGMSNMWYGRSFPIRLLTLPAILKMAGFPITARQSMIAFGALLIFLSWLFFRLRTKNNTAEPLFLFAFLLFILSEFFTPAARGGYNLIMWIFPVSLIYLRARTDHIVLIIMATGLLLLHNFPFFFQEQGQLVEFIFILLVCLFVYFPKQIKTIPDGVSRTGYDT